MSGHGGTWKPEKKTSLLPFYLLVLDDPVMNIYPHFNPFNKLTSMSWTKVVKVNASAMTKWRPNHRGDLMVT